MHFPIFAKTTKGYKFKHNSPYHQGARAYYTENEDKNSNPYKTGSDEYLEWRDGYEEEEHYGGWEQSPSLFELEEHQ